MSRAVRIAALAVSALLALTGCSALGLSPGSPGVTATRSGPVQLPEKTVYTGGNGSGASPTPYPNGSPIRTPLGSLPSLPATSGYPTMGATPTMGYCPFRVTQGMVDGLTVTLSGKTATVTWWNVLDPALQQFQLATVLQPEVLGPQQPWKWTTVTPAKGCVPLKATISGLVSGNRYIFVLHAVVGTYVSEPPIIPEIGRSSVIAVP